MSKRLIRRNRAALALAGLAIIFSAGLTPTAGAQPTSPDWGEADLARPISTEDITLAAAPITRAEILARAATWTGVPYSQGAYHPTPWGAFRQDCSGFVSMTWGLPGRPQDPNGGTNTVGLTQISRLISKDELQPGDALIDALGTNVTRHVALFVGWANRERTRYWAYEQSGPRGSLGAKYRIINYPYDGGGAEYRPYRYNNIIDDPVGPMFYQVRGADGESWSGFEPMAGFGTSLPGDARDVAVTGLPDGSAQVLIVGADGAVYHQVRYSDGQWSGFWPLDGMGTSEAAGGRGVAIAGMPDGSAQVVIIGADGRIYHQVRYSDGQWSGFWPLAGMGTPSPAAGRDVAIAGMPDGSAQVLIVGADGRIYHQVRDPDGNWSGFWPVAGMNTTDPAGGSRVSITGMPDGSAQVAIIGADGRVYHQVRHPDGNWSGFVPVAGMNTTDPAGGKDVAITGTPDGNAQLLIIGADDRVYHQDWLAADGTWTGFQPLPGIGTTDPAGGSRVSITGLPDNAAHITVVGQR